MSDLSSGGTQVRRSTEERRQDTISAVVELAALDSPDRLTTARIARHMGLSDAILFRHFPDKAAVWAAVMKWVASTLETRFRKVEVETDDPMEALQRLFRLHVDFVHAHPGIPRLLFAELQRPNDTVAKQLVREFLAQHGVRIRRLLEAGRTRGHFRADLDLEAATTLFIGCIQGLVMQTLLSGDSDRMPQTADGILELFCHSILQPS